MWWRFSSEGWTTRSGPKRKHIVVRLRDKYLVICRHFQTFLVCGHLPPRCPCSSLSRGCHALGVVLKATSYRSTERSLTAVYDVYFSLANYAFYKISCCLIYSLTLQVFGQELIPLTNMFGFTRIVDLIWIHTNDTRGYNIYWTFLDVAMLSSVVG